LIFVTLTGEEVIATRGTEALSTLTRTEVVLLREWVTSHTVNVSLEVDGVASADALTRIEEEWVSAIATPHPSSASALTRSHFHSKESPASTPDTVALS